MVPEVPEEDVSEVLEDFKCPLSQVDSLEEWFSDHDAEEECRPCTLSALASLYVGHLEEVGENEKAEELKLVYEQGNILTIAKTMDRIKADVEEPIKRNLKKLDCFSQTFTEDMQDQE
jgi:hypothetical protein